MRPLFKQIQTKQSQQKIINSFLSGSKEGAKRSDQQILDRQIDTLKEQEDKMKEVVKKAEDGSIQLNFQIQGQIDRQQNVLETVI